MRKLFIPILIIIGFQTTFSQTDSIIVSKSTSDSVDNKYDRIYKLFVEENNQEIKHLWKVDLISLKATQFNVSYEQKIIRCLSSETNILFSYVPKSSFLNSLFTGGELKIINKYAPIDESLYNGYMIGGYEKLKFYYNLNHRQRINKNINGFSGNYFSIHLASTYANSNIRTVEYYKKHNISMLSYGFGYGLQRRIGNIGYFEPSFNVSFLPNYYLSPDNRTNIAFVFDIKAGFSLESFSNLERMLKK